MHARDRVMGRWCREKSDRSPSLKGFTPHCTAWINDYPVSNVKCSGMDPRLWQQGKGLDECHEVGIRWHSLLESCLQQKGVCAGVIRGQPRDTRDLGCISETMLSLLWHDWILCFNSIVILSSATVVLVCGPPADFCLFLGGRAVFTTSSLTKLKRIKCVDRNDPWKEFVNSYS